MKNPNKFQKIALVVTALLVALRAIFPVYYDSITFGVYSRGTDFGANVLHILAALMVGGVAYLLLGELKNKGNDLDPLVKSLSAEDYFKRAFAKQESGDNKGAIADCTKAIERNPKFAGAYNNRGNAKYNLKDYRGAIEDYIKAIELDPKDASAYNNRGLAKQKLGDTEWACQDWRKAGELGNKNALELIKKYCQ